MLLEIKNAIAERDAARKRIETSQQQISAITDESDAASADLAALKNNASEPLSDLARQVAEKNNLVELGGQRKAKLGAELPEHRQAEQSSENRARHLLTSAFDVLTKYRRHLAMHRISKQICAQVSPHSLSLGASRVWIKQAIYDLSAHAAELDATSTLASYAYGGGREERAVNVGPTDNALAHLVSNESDLQDALAWWEEYQNEIISGPRSVNGAYDRIEAVPLYVQQSF